MMQDTFKHSFCGHERGYWGPCLPEAYAQGPVEIHLHFRAGEVVNRTVAGNHCAVFNLADPMLDIGGSAAFDEEFGVFVGEQQHQEGQPVLVAV
jgi:hypothetical protein